MANRYPQFRTWNRTASVHTSEGPIEAKVRIEHTHNGNLPDFELWTRYADNLIAPQMWIEVTVTVALNKALRGKRGWIEVRYVVVSTGATHDVVRLYKLLPPDKYLQRVPCPIAEGTLTEMLKCAEMIGVAPFKLEACNLPPLKEDIGIESVVGSIDELERQKLARRKLLEEEYDNYSPEI